MWLLSIRVQVSLLPLQAGGAGLGEEPDFAFPVDHLPLLRGVVEFDIGGAVDFKLTEFMERNSLGPKTKGGSIGVELKGGVHGG